MFVTAGVDNTIRIFKGLDDEDGQSIEQHSDPVTALCIKASPFSHISPILFLFYFSPPPVPRLLFAHFANGAAACVTAVAPVDA